MKDTWRTSTLCWRRPRKEWWLPQWPAPGSKMCLPLERIVENYKQLMSLSSFPPLTAPRKLERCHTESWKYARIYTLHSKNTVSVAKVFLFSSMRVDTDWGSRSSFTIAGTANPPTMMQRTRVWSLPSLMDSTGLLTRVSTAHLSNLPCTTWQGLPSRSELSNFHHFVLYLWFEKLGELSTLQVG